MKVRKHLTGSRITMMRELYTVIDNVFIANKTDEMDYDVLFAKVMKNTRGHIPPNIVQEEINKI